MNWNQYLESVSSYFIMRLFFNSFRAYLLRVCWARVDGGLSWYNASRYIFSYLLLLYLCPVEIQKHEKDCIPHVTTSYMIALLIDGYIFVLVILWREPFIKVLEHFQRDDQLFWMG